MSITIRTINGRYRPLAVCDACGEPITDPPMGAVVFDMEGPTDRAPQLAHKGGCHDALDEKIRASGGFPGWNCFDRWMGDLLYNTGLRGDALTRALETSDHWQEMGL